jgi:hypothetical protein
VPRGGPIAFTVAVVLVLGLTAAEFSRSRQAAGPPGAGGEVVPATRPGRTVPFPPAAGFTTATRFATDGDLEGGAGLWSVERAGDGVRMSSWRLRGGGIVAGPAHVLPGVADATVDVGRWSQAHPSVAMTARSVAGGVRVVVHGLEAGAPLVRQGVATGLPPAPREGRFLAFARWSGRRPDLFVIDAAAEQEHMLVRAYSGESGFRELVLFVMVPFGGFPLSRWAVDVGAVNGAAADLAIVSRNAATATGKAEIHVATATSGYQAWAQQAPLPLDARESAGRRFLLGHVEGRPVIYAIDLSARQLLIADL